MRHDTRKILEENPLITRGLYGGGGGGGGGGDGDIGDVGDVGPSDADIGMMADIGMDASGIQGAINAASIGNMGLGQGVSPIGIGVSALGNVVGMSTAGLGLAATLGNMANDVTGFSGGTPGIGTGDPGSPSSPGGGNMASNDIYFDPGTGAWVDRRTNQFVPGPAALGGGVTLGDVSGGRTGQIGGAPAGGNIQQNFDAAAYLRANPDVAAAGMDPWVHYTTYGAREGRAFTPVGGGAGGAPAALDPQAQLRQAQIDLVNQQRDIATQMLQRQNLLQDQLLAQQGMTAVRDAQGNITGYQPTPERAAQDAQQNQIAQQLRQRTLDALAGNLPVDPALERGLTEQRATLEAQLRGNLGTGYATSTPGIESLANFDKRAEELRSQARHDQLTTAEGLRLSGQQIGTQSGASNLASILGITNAGSIPAGILSSAGSGLTPSLSNLLGLSSLDNSWRIAQLQGSNAQSTLAQQLAAQDNAGWGQVAGQLGSAFLRSDLASNMWDSFAGLF